jgi:ABC-type transporter Mla subunit MlaD
MVVAVALAVLLFARPGAIRGDTFRLFVRVGSSRGLMKGSEVWVGGQRVGSVSNVRFLRPTGDSAGALLVEMDVLERHRHAIRRDSRVEIRAGARLISPPVVAIGPGSTRARVVRERDTLRGGSQADVEGVLGRFGEATRQFPAVVADVKRVSQQLRNPRGTIGAFGSERGGVELAAVRARGSRLAESVGNARGTLGRLLEGREALTARAQTVLARADSVQQLIGSSDASVGRFRRDSTLQAAVQDIQQELATVRTLLEEARGSAGRFQRDSAIVRELIETQREMGAIMADIRRRPFRYLNF